MMVIIIATTATTTTTPNNTTGGSNDNDNKNGDRYINNRKCHKGSHIKTSNLGRKSLSHSTTPFLQVEANP